MESEMQKEIREIEEKKMIIEREKRDKETQIREKEIQLQKEIKEREFEARIFIENKRTMMVLYRSPEHICNLYGLSRAGY